MNYPARYFTNLFFFAGDSTKQSRLEEPCDPAKHPIIIDFATQTLESINPSALQQLIIYDD
jgi:hypothetical protein